MGRFRTAVLTIDRSTVLPLIYQYDETENCFRSVGFIRVGPMMVPELSHSTSDTARGRDEFLMKVLAAVLVPADRARKVVRNAQHEPK